MYVPYAGRGYMDGKSIIIRRRGGARRSMCINGAGKGSSGGGRGRIRVKKLVFGGMDGNQI